MVGYYAVRVGRIPGVYRTWEECKTQVHRFTGCVYKRFDNPWAAKNFMNNVIKPPPKFEVLKFVNYSRKSK